MRLSRSASLPMSATKSRTGLHIHLVCLQNGIRQQPDGRQRRFQLMAGVGHKPAAQGLRGLKPVRQAVEFLADLGDLVPAARCGSDGS